MGEDEPQPFQHVDEASHSHTGTGEDQPQPRRRSSGGEPQPSTTRSSYAPSPALCSMRVYGSRMEDEEERKNRLTGWPYVLDG